MTETFNKEKDAPISMKHYNRVYVEATRALPNNNILNIISKAKAEPQKEMVLELFKTDREMEFSFDDESLNYLYMNGIIDLEQKTDATEETNIYCRFACPFVQSRLFKGKSYGMELKSYSDYAAYPGSLKQAALYGKQLKLEIIYLLFVVTAIDEENRKKLGAIYSDPETGLK